MRNLVFLLIGLAAMLGLGVWLAESMVPAAPAGPQKIEAPVASADSTDWTLIWMLIAASWGSVLLPLPRWLSVPVSFAVVGFGALFALFGGLSGYADDYLRPGHRTGWAMFWCGIAMVASRLVPFYRWFRKLPEEEFMP